MGNVPKEVILGPMRLPFLVLAPVCVLLGVAAARWTGAALAPLSVVLVFVGGVAVHVGVNALNEYHDFKSGLDFQTRPTPFSGGSKALPAHPEQAHVALNIGRVALAVTAAVGIYFLFVYGAALLPLGLVGLLLVVAYTPLITHHVVGCLVAPGLGFGLLMVMGSSFAVGGGYSWTAFVASLVPFFLVADLLLLNQFPDLEADSSAGRRHLIIVHGRRAGVRVYILFLVGAYLAIVAGWLARVLPPASLLGLLTLPLAVSAARGAVRYNADIPRLIPFLGQNVILNLATPLLVAVGLFLGG